MSERTIRVGTRGSALARIQTQTVADALGAPTEIVHIVTAGDRSAAPVEQQRPSKFRCSVCNRSP